MSGKKSGNKRLKEKAAAKSLARSSVSAEKAEAAGAPVADREVGEPKKKHQDGPPGKKSGFLDTASGGASTGTAKGGRPPSGADAEQAEAAKNSVSRSKKTGRADFFFTVGFEAGETFLRFNYADARGQNTRNRPDFRRYTGKEREALREFFSKLGGRERSFIVDFDGNGEENAIYNPDDRLVDQILSAKLLRNTKGDLLSRAESRCRCVLVIKDEGRGQPAIGSGQEKAAGRQAKPSGWLTSSLALQDEEGALIELPAGEFFMLTPRLGVYGDKIYQIEDLGLRWAETGRIQARMRREDMPAFLSLIFSGYSNLELIYEGWTMRNIRPNQALPALLFMEIDDYSYLHVRPISYIKGFPSLFLENEDIVTVAEIDETGKIIGIAEVIFPEAPEDVFRSMLYKGIPKGTAKSLIHEEQGRFIIAPEFAQKFFAENIIELSRYFVLLESQVLAGYKLSFARPHIRFSMGMGHGIDYLSGSAEVEIEGERFSFNRFMEEYRKHSCITLADGTRSFPDKHSMDRLDRLVSRISNDQTVELSYFDVPLLLQDDCIEVEGKAWEDARAFFNNYNSIPERKGNWSLENGALRPYQEFGVRWLDYLREHQMGACLADEMGLGKTIQVIALLRNLYAAGEQGNCLILCPKSLVFNWAAELERFAPNLPVKIHYGAARDAGALESGGFRIILSTYATIRRDVEEFVNIEFLYIILDESQNIKNLTTQTAGAVISLKSRYRLAMSGTPVENNLSELYSLFRFLNPSFFGSERLFIQRYLRPIQENNDEESLRDLKTRIYPFMLRRLKRDVLKDLPPKTEETAYIELEDAHLKVYHRRRLEYKLLFDGLMASGEMAKSSIIIFKALAELRRLASVPESDGEYAGPSAKRQYLRDMITELVENGHKCLIFTNFLAHIDLVSQDLADMGIANLTMTGATVDRQSLVRRFQTDENVKAFIMTLKTGGTGLNLTAADYIFILDPWWNSAVETQAIDRSHRIGQANPVFCYRLIARDTIEERILELQKRKTDLAGALLSDDAGSLKSLSPEDIAYLVGDSP